MPLYRIANLLVDSAVALPGATLVKAATTRTPRTWRFVVDRRPSRARYAWHYHEESPDGRLRRSLARDGDRDVIRFARRAVFVVSFRERAITCHPRPSTALEGVRQLLLGQVLPLVFAERGALALHASAVRLPEGVVTFVGETRGGKSTIAAALGARGCPLLADDCAIVEVTNGTCRVRPMHVGMRLWPDAITMLRAPSAKRRHPMKTRVAAESLGIATHTKPAPLHRVYLLESAAGERDVAIDAVSRPDAVVALLVASFHLGMDQPERLRRAFENLSTIVAQVPVRRIRRPNGLRHLAQIVQAILDDARL
jgi:hypothetical protein